MSVQIDSPAALRLRVLQAFIRSGNRTYLELARELDVNEARVHRIMNDLRLADMVEETGQGDRGASVFGLTSTGTGLAREEIAAHRQRSIDPQDNMWRTARQLRAFGALDLVAWSSTDEVPVSESMARQFCALLLKGGYVRVTRKAKPGINDAMYRLIRDTGPKAPTERRIRAIFDPNQGRFVHVPEPKQ